MRRFLTFLAPFAVAALLPLAVTAQSGQIIVTPVVVFETPAFPTPEAQQLAPTEAPALVNDALPVLISVRSDLELLATSELGAARPPGWSGSLDISDPQLGVLARLDLELLAGQLLGPDVRPAGWFGAVGGTPFTVARDIRHDLELLADALIEPGVRPPGWAGSDPLMRCSRATQSLVRWLERNGYLLQADPSSPAFCEQAEIDASRFVETTLISTPIVPTPDAVEAASAMAGVGGTVRENLRGVAVFADRNARLRLGVLPRGVPFAAVARSMAPFSNMMLVRGEGFEVFIDYTFTSVTRADFEALPDVNTTFPQITCQAAWCD
ncbi:MAG: hypothetical protein DIU68_012480 [Chloroflexota bacterium]|mgnify:CR=1 FL=1|nr:MAG: hypothetical protein DIU68_17020 [Chloroflexota bacterium]